MEQKAIDFGNRFHSLFFYAAAQKLVKATRLRKKIKAERAAEAPFAFGGAVVSRMISSGGTANSPDSL